MGRSALTRTLVTVTASISFSGNRAIVGQGSGTPRTGETGHIELDIESRLRLKDRLPSMHGQLNVVRANWEDGGRWGSKSGVVSYSIVLNSGRLVGSVDSLLPIQNLQQ